MTGGEDGEGGDEPDPRWSLANERTLLAYIRTALALVVAGVAIAASPTVADTPGWVAALGFPLMVMGAAVSFAGRKRYLAWQRAMRLREPMDTPTIASMLPWGITLFAVGGLVATALALILT